MTARKQKTWNEMFNRLCHYKDTCGGDVSIVVPEPDDDPELCAWVRDQRRQYRILQDEEAGGGCKPKANPDSDKNINRLQRQEKNEKNKGKDWCTLDFSRIMELERIGFSWDMNHDLEWKYRFNELVVYKDRHGDCIVPARCSENPELGRWVMTQRRQYALLTEGKPHRMTKYRKDLLNSIEFKWIIRNDRGRQSWKHFFADLEEFQKQFGNTNVPNPYPPNINLGKWVRDLRLHFARFQQKKTSTLTKANIAKLDKMGFMWAGPSPPVTDVARSPEARLQTALLETDNNNTQPFLYSATLQEQSFGLPEQLMQQQYSAADQPCSQVQQLIQLPPDRVSPLVFFHESPMAQGYLDVAQSLTQSNQMRPSYHSGTIPTFAQAAPPPFYQSNQMAQIYPYVSQQSFPPWNQMMQQRRPDTQQLLTRSEHMMQGMETYATDPSFTPATSMAASSSNTNYTPFMQPQISSSDCLLPSQQQSFQMRSPLRNSVDLASQGSFLHDAPPPPKSRKLDSPCVKIYIIGSSN